MTLQLAQSYPSLAQRVQSVDQQSLKTLLTTRFGVPSTVLENIYFFQSNRRSVSIVNAEHADLADQAEAHGIPLRVHRQRGTKANDRSSLVPRASRHREYCSS